MTTDTAPHPDGDNPPVSADNRPGNRRRPYTRLSSAQRAELTKQIVASYRTGTSIRRIAAGIGRSYGFVHDALTNAGEQRRPQGGHARTDKQRS